MIRANRDRGDRTFTGDSRPGAHDLGVPARRPAVPTLRHPHPRRIARRRSDPRAHRVLVPGVPDGAATRRPGQASTLSGRSVAGHPSTRLPGAVRRPKPRGFPAVTLTRTICRSGHSRTRGSSGSPGADVARSRIRDIEYPDIPTAVRRRAAREQEGHHDVTTATDADTAPATNPVASEGRGAVVLDRICEALRRPARGRRPLADDRAGRVHLAARSVRLRQDHDAAHDRGIRRAGCRRHPRLGTQRAGHAAVPPRREHGLPGLRALPAHERRRERRLRPAAASHARRPRSASASRPRSTWCRCAASPIASPPSSRAASSSASRWRAPSSTARPCCCSTSRSARSTVSCAKRCSSS